MLTKSNNYDLRDQDLVWSFGLPFYRTWIFSNKTILREQRIIHYVLKGYFVEFRSHTREAKWLYISEAVNKMKTHFSVGERNIFYIKFPMWLTKGTTFPHKQYPRNHQASFVYTWDMTVLSYYVIDLFIHVLSTC